MRTPITQAGLGFKEVKHAFDDDMLTYPLSWMLIVSMISFRRLKVNIVLSILPLNLSIEQ